MTDVAISQIWEIYSDRENRWIRAVIAKQDGGKVTLRYEGSLELITVSVEDLQNNPESFRVVID